MIDWDELAIQLEIFSPKAIMSISFSESGLIKDILNLHCDGYIQLDPTYSTGSIYKKLKKPRYKFDIKPQTADTVRADVRNLPLSDSSIKTIMFDPPFVISGDTKDTKDGSCIIAKRFSSFKNWNELKKFYTESLIELSRILKPDGTLIFKCQDIVSSGKNHFSHVYIMTEAIKAGLYPKDMFILLRKNRLIGGAIKQQQHARKFHSYFWVLKKTSPRVIYGTEDEI